MRGRLVVGGVVAIGAASTSSGSLSGASGSIARVKIDGLIRSDYDRVAALERLEADLHGELPRGALLDAPPHRLDPDS